jgi:hypothetical protein
LLLAADSSFHAVVVFVPNQNMHIMRGGEFGEGFGLMFRDAFPKS